MSTETPGYPVPGEMVGPYRIERRLGFGGMGVVFAAFDASLQRSVALKIISPHLADDEGFRARFVREAQAQASVRSPHVVAVHSHGEADGRLYIATELVDAGDLGRLVLEHGPPPMPVALDILAQVASGLADAHAAGLVHRDIKPANVLLRRREDGVQAYLADFGIARQVGVDPAFTQVGGTVGTPSYMAPELHTGGRAGLESDIYSLGCLLWAALTGTAPFAGGSDYEVVTAHREQPVPQLRGGTPAAEKINQILLRSLAKRPTERYVGAGAMARDLRAALALAETSEERAVPAGGSGRPIASRTHVSGSGAPAAAEGSSIFGNRHTPTPTPAPPRVISPSPATPGYTGRRRRVALVVAAVLLALVAGAGVAYALTRDSGDDDGPRAVDPSSSGEPSEPTQDATDGEVPSDVNPPTGEPTAAQRQRLIDTIAAGVGDFSPLITPDIAQCVAEGWVEQAGVEALVEAGFVDVDWSFVDRPDDDLTPALRDGVERAATICLQELMLSSFAG